MSAFRSEADIGRTRRPVPDPKRTLSRQTESKFLEAATDRHMRIVTNLIHIKVGTRKNSIVDAIYFRSQTKGGGKLRGALLWCSATETTFVRPRPAKNSSSLTFRMTNWSALPPLSVG